MKPGNSLAFGGLSCVHLVPSDTDAEVILNYAADIGAIDRDGKEELIIVRFPEMSSDEAVTEEELKARLTTPLVNG